MAKKKKEEKKEVSLDDLEDELADALDEEDIEEIAEEEEEIEEIDEFTLDEISEEEEISEIFEEELEEREELEAGEEVAEIPEEEIIDERIYVVPLAKARKGPRNKWAKKSVRYLREYMTRHMKPESLVISQECNEKIWARGISKPPRKIKIRATKNIDGLVVVYLA